MDGFRHNVANDKKSCLQTSLWRSNGQTNIHSIMTGSLDQVVYSTC